MSSKIFSDWRDTGKKIAMSEKAGKLKNLKTLVDTACVHVNERELIAWCMVYGKIVPEDKEFIKFLEEVAIPALREVGLARWYRSEVTDLGLALSQRESGVKNVDSSNILDVDGDVEGKADSV